MKVKSLSCVQLLATPWTAAYQALPSMGFSRQEYWSGVPLPSPILDIEKSKTIIFILLKNRMPFKKNNKALEIKSIIRHFFKLEKLKDKIEIDQIVK